MPLAQIEVAVADYLRTSGAALLARRKPPLLDGVESALVAYAAEVAELRADGLTRSLADDDRERFFALGFVLEQMHQNLMELDERVTEWAVPPKPADRTITGS
jgi:hypothetical protein